MLPFYDTRNHGLGTVPEPFTEAPLELLQQWLLTRRKGKDFLHTPMGHICSRKVVKEDSVFFATKDKLETP